MHSTVDTIISQRFTREMKFYKLHRNIPGKNKVLHISMASSDSFCCSVWSHDGQSQEQTQVPS